MDTLFISAGFFGYYKEIISKLESQGRSVLWFEDRPATDGLTKAALRVAPSLLRNRCCAYFDAIIQQARQHDIRDVLVIKGEGLLPETIAKMRRALPKARFTLYYWDSYRNMPAESPQKVDFFDRVFSFDPDDVVSDRRLTYRPLFYVDGFAKIAKPEPDIDVLFIGTVHSDRYAVIRRIEAALPPELSFKSLLYMRTRQLYWVSRVVKPSYWRAREAEFIFDPISRGEVMSLISRARMVIDVERAIQTGFTMRTIEMLGASKKLITTNRKIETADFYLPSNQLYVDRYKVSIPDAFLTSEWQACDPQLLGRYSLDGWMKEVLG
ncbi:MAG: hypothetical protein QM803_14025 [Rhodocyclaceae bacterium]